MFWITFLVSGLTVAMVPIVAKHLGNQIAGFLLLLPVMFTASIIVMYLTNGQNATIQMIKASIVGYPTILVFLVLCIVLLQRHMSLPVVLGISLSGWLVTAFIVNMFLAK
jgi:uncharacterized membrane protein (GlpM family)